MKTVVSFISVALLSLAFASGCGGEKKKNCSDAKKSEECTKKENFENNKECFWEVDSTKALTGASADTDKSCIEKAEKDKAALAGKAHTACAGKQNPATQADCDNVITDTDVNTKYECKISTATPLKCEAKAK